MRSITRFHKQVEENKHHCKNTDKCIVIKLLLRECWLLLLTACAKWHGHGRGFIFE